MGTIFISYSHIDKEIVDEFVKTLDDMEIECFRDIKDIKLGESITSKVSDNIKSALIMVVVLSPASLKSHWVPFEVGQAVALGKRLIPLLTHPSLDIPLYIQDINSAVSLDKLKQYFSEQFHDELKSGKLAGNEKRINVVDIHLNMGQNFSKEVEKLYENADSMNDSEAWEQAINYYRSVVKLAPDHWKAHYNIGYCLIRQENLDAAKEAFLALSNTLEGFSIPEDSPMGELLISCYIQMANICERSADFMESYKWLHKGKTVNNECSLLHLDLMLICVKLGKLDEAKGWLTQLIKDLGKSKVKSLIPPEEMEVLKKFPWFNTLK